MRLSATNLLLAADNAYVGWTNDIRPTSPFDVFEVVELDQRLVCMHSFCNRNFNGVGGGSVTQCVELTN